MTRTELDDIKKTLISFDDLEEKYGLVDNHIDVNSSYERKMFETYGPELEFIKEKDADFICTIMDSEITDELLVVPGCHFVNRVGYLITEKSIKELEEKSMIIVDDIDGYLKKIKEHDDREKAEAKVSSPGL